MTTDEQKKVRQLAQALFPDEMRSFDNHGRLGESKRLELQWRVYHALIKVELL